MIQPVFGNLWLLETPFGMIVVLVVVLLLFGPSKLAGLGKSLGEGLRDFKKAVNEPDEPTKIVEAKKDETSPVKSDKGE